MSLSPATRATDSRRRRSDSVTQQAVVTEIFDDGYALVAVQRGTACGGVCESCGGTCAYRSTVTVRASNAVCAGIGDHVTIASSSSQVLGKAALVYLLPLAAFFAGYLFAYAFGAPESIEIAASVFSFFIGTAAVVLLNHRRKSRSIDFEIIGID